MEKSLKRSPLSHRNGDIVFSSMLVAPTLLITTIFILIPVIDSVFKSFLD